MIAWPDGVNTVVLRETTGSIPVGVIADETRCGRKRTRPANQTAPRVFSVVMKFSYQEFIIFENWFLNDLRNGALSFAFPRINGIEKELTEYRFSPGTNYEWENPSGKIIKVNMQWETV